MTDPFAARLAVRLAEDPEAAFPDLVRAYAGPVLSVLRRNGVDGPTAEDLAQETFTRAWTALRRCPPRQPRAWLLTIALNLLRNHWRTLDRRPRTTAQLDTDGPDGRSDGIEATSLGGHDDDLSAALARLGEPQRTAVVLRHVVGLPTTEVAEVLQVPLGTAKSHISRGLAALRRDLRTDEQEGER